MKILGGASGSGGFHQLMAWQGATPCYYDAISIGLCRKGSPGAHPPPRTATKKEGARERRLSTAGGCKLVPSLWKSAQRLFKNLKLGRPVQLGYLIFLGIHPDDAKSAFQTNRSVFAVALFTIANLLK